MGRQSRACIIAFGLAAFTTPLSAQPVEAPLPDPESVRNNWTIAGGIGWVPDYVGSDDYKLIPVAAIRGSIGPVRISTQGTYLHVDVVADGPGKMGVDAGPIIGVRRNRTGDIKDDFVELLPDRKTAWEVGGFAGLSFKQLTNPYDSLSVRIEVVHDVGNAHESTVISPNVSFSTPLSRWTYVSVSAGAEFVSDKLADYYFSLSLADSLASGLPAFDADGGMKEWKAGLLVNQAITGDLTGGISIFGTANYSRLTGDFDDSPIVSVRGSASQWLLATGLAYTW